MYKITLYSTPKGNRPVEDYLKKLSQRHKKDEFSAVQLYVARLQKYGKDVNSYYRGTIKNLGKGLYELRPSATRVFFIFFQGDEIVLLHAIEKKRQDLPDGEIERARKEKEEFIRRNKNAGR